MTVYNLASILFLSFRYFYSILLFFNVIFTLLSFLLSIYYSYHSTLITSSLSFPSSPSLLLLPFFSYPYFLIIPFLSLGIDRVNGNIFERWTCNKCKGFGQVSCTCTGEKGLTPEQRYVRTHMCVCV